MGKDQVLSTASKDRHCCGRHDPSVSVTRAWSRLRS